MGLNIYNDNEEKFSETLKSLKELPKVNAPDNFEFNLMLKITNGEFEPEAEEKRQSKLLWILTPAALVVTSVILFVTLTQDNFDQKLSPLQNQGSIYTGRTGENGKPADNKDLAQPDRKSQQIRPQAPVQGQLYSNQNQNNQQYPVFPINPFQYKRPLRLDDLLNGSGRLSDGGTQTAKSTNDGSLIPDELFQKESISNKTAADRKAVKDSLKNINIKNDSIKLKKNVQR